MLEKSKCYVISISARRTAEPSQSVGGIPPVGREVTFGSGAYIGITGDVRAALRAGVEQARETWPPADGWEGHAADAHEFKPEEIREMMDWSDAQPQGED